MDSIVMKNVTKKFSGRKVLDNISVTVKDGEIFGLLGPSGAGKTTIIKILTGQLRTTEGETYLFDTDTKEITDEIYSKIGMVLDNSGLYQRLSCYDNLLIFSEIYGTDKTSIRDILEKIGLLNDAKKPVNNLSKGMMQRLILARAIMHKPKILFLDEPTSGLDPATMQSIHQLINELKDLGTTIFLTTHNMHEATILCNNIALLNDGQIIEYGPPKDICRKYNKKKTISILLKNGEMLEVSNKKENAAEIAELFENEMIESIHSSEPNLESVFIELTGRKLV